MGSQTQNGPATNFEPLIGRSGNVFCKLEIKEILRQTNFLGIKVSKNPVLTHDMAMMRELRLGNQ